MLFDALNTAHTLIGRSEENVECIFYIWEVDEFFGFGQPSFCDYNTGSTSIHFIHEHFMNEQTNTFTNERTVFFPYERTNEKNYFFKMLRTKN